MKKKIKAWIMIRKDSGEELNIGMERRKQIFHRKLKGNWRHLECVPCTITYEVKKRKK